MRDRRHIWTNFNAFLFRVLSDKQNSFATSSLQQNNLTAKPGRYISHLERQLRAKLKAKTCSYKLA